jgi:rubrerythrin
VVANSNFADCAKEVLIVKLLEKAIQMEVDAGQYYHQQAFKNQGNPLEDVFILLAKQELKHEEILNKLLAGSPPAIDESEVADSERLFANLGDFKAEAGYLADQLEVYRTAMGQEQKMVEFYQNMEKDTTDPKIQRLLSFLVKQEQRHFTLFETLEQLVQRPTDWVEAAEFGKREEY